MAREALLGTLGYGIFTALFSTLALEGILSPAIATVAERRVATAAASGEGRQGSTLIRHAAFWGLCLGSGLTILFVLLSPFLARFFRLSSVGPVLLLALFPPLNLFLAVLAGALQGLLRFAAMSLVLLVTAVTRVAVAIPVVLLWDGSVSGALGATLAAASLGAGLAAALLRRALGAPRAIEPRPPPAAPAPALGDDLGVASLALAGLALLSTTDVVLARHVLSAEQAGLYSVLALLGRVAYFGSLPIILVMFSVLSRRAARRAGIRAPLLVSGPCIVGLCALTVALYAAVPLPILRLTVGGGAEAGAPLLWRFGAFFGLLALGHWLTYVGMALGWRSLAFVPLPAAALQAFLILRFSPTLTSLLGSSVVAASVLVAVSGATLFSLKAAQGRAAAMAQAGA